MKISTRRPLQTLLVTILTTILLMGCSEESLVSSETGYTESAVSQNVKPEVIDVDGTWNWTRVEHLTFPAWVAPAIFGIQPEGPTTSARCHGSGTMTLNQTGAGFTGTFQPTHHECVTKGGQVFQATGAGAISDGTVQGRNVTMLRDTDTADCIYRLVATEVIGRTAVALDGGATCTVPGHPKSDFPLDPPPAGTDKMLSFTASR